MYPRSLIVAFCLLSGLSVFPANVSAVQPLNTRDVSSSDLDRVALEFLNQHDILYGYLDGTIHPNNPITRAELLKVVLESRGLGAEALRAPETALRFSDVPTSHSLRAYVRYAIEHSIASGYPDGRFKPDANVTRAEAMKLITSNASVCPYLTQTPYVDIADSTLRAPIELAYQLEWFKPSGTSYAPTQPILRREVAQTIYRAILARSSAEPVMPGACADKYNNESAPSSTEADWSIVGDSIRAALPAGWSYKEVKGDGYTSIVLDPVSVSTNASQAQGAIEITKSSSPPTELLGAVTNRVYRYRQGVGAEFIDVKEATLEINGSIAMQWTNGAQTYVATFDVEKFPGLKGVFYRVVQNAVQGN